MAYLDMAGINACISFLGATYPSMVSVITLPEPSRNGSAIRAYRLGAGSKGNRRGVLALGGVHARELVNPDMLLSLSIKMCEAYKTGSGLTFGGKSFSATDVKLVLDALDVYVIPVVNPDGRSHVQSPSGYAMWRKNRTVIPGSGCIGVDLNRNADFLWPFTIGQTSAQPCADTYHGTAAFSEPEERNVRWMLDAHASIRCLVDVHSYSELVLYPRGDDTIQSGDPTQNFENPVWDGQRGAAGGYAEFMPTDDKQRFEQTALSVVEAIKAVRGHTYTPEPSFALYGTSGTNSDYAYSRHLAGTGASKVYGFTFETGREFQPAAAEAAWVIKEGSAGVFQLLLRSICAIEFVASALQDGQAALNDTELAGLSDVRDSMMIRTAAGRRLAALVEEHSVELATIAQHRPRIARRMASLLADIAPAALGREPITDAQLAKAADLATQLAKVSSPELRAALDEASAMAPHFAGETLRRGLQAASRRTAKSRRRRT